MTLCVALRTDITQSKGDFPIPDFASTYADSLRDLIQDIKLFAAPIINRGRHRVLISRLLQRGIVQIFPTRVILWFSFRCVLFNLLLAGVYFPILRVSNWQSLKYEFISDPVVRGFIYFFGVVFILLSFVCMYQVCSILLGGVQWCLTAAGVCGFSERTRARVSQSRPLAILVHVSFQSWYCYRVSNARGQYLLFATVRGIYLLVLPSGKLEDNIAGKYFLAELPQFLFFSVFSIIIFCWYVASFVLV